MTFWKFPNFQIPDSRKCCNMNIFCFYVKKQIIGSILDYFFTFQVTSRISGFPDSRSWKIWKFSENCYVLSISSFFPLSFGYWAWFWAQNFKIPFFQKFAGISRNCLRVHNLWPFLQSGTFFPSILVTDFNFSSKSCRF